VSGRADDRALDNSTAFLSPSPGVSPWSEEGGWAVNTKSDALEKLQSFTLSGWYKRQPRVQGGDPPYGGTVLICVPAALQGPGFGLRWEVPFPGVSAFNYSAAFRYDLSGQGARSADDSAHLWTDEGIWVFFAVSYDATTGSLKVYRGYRNAGEAGMRPVKVTLVASMIYSTPDAAGINPARRGYQLLNRVGNDRAFDGLLDNIRIDGSTIDSSGALSLAALEAYRVGDIAPEAAPSASALAPNSGRLPPAMKAEGVVAVANFAVGSLALAAGVGLVVAHYLRRRTGGLVRLG
jgi:hypothetical protein